MRHIMEISQDLIWGKARTNGWFVKGRAVTRRVEHRYFLTYSELYLNRTLTHDLNRTSVLSPGTIKNAKSFE
jgi:hypothetical protein